LVDGVPSLPPTEKVNFAAAFSAEGGFGGIRRWFEADWTQNGLIHHELLRESAIQIHQA
jgi:hypothetical protein